MLRRALSDEHQALLCLKLCSDMEEVGPLLVALLQKSSRDPNVETHLIQGALRMSEHPSGLFTVSVCVMSNFTKSRVLALQVDISL